MAMQEMRDDGFGGSASGRLGRGASRREPRPAVRMRPETEEDEGSEGDGIRRPRKSASGIRLTFRAGLLPATTRGRIAGGFTLLVCGAMLAGAGFEGRQYLLHDDRFVIPSSSSIEIQGNRHLSRAQLLSVFGEDVDRNVFRTSLDERRTELEALPWVEHATVMRLLPNRLRVAIVERTPVAFVRQGKRIGLVDRNGILLDMAADSEESSKFSFPVLTGLTQELPQSVRAARMKIFERFQAEMEGSKENIASRLSEVDLSNPEDVKALIQDQDREILVHFGDRDFLERYEKFRDQMPGWRTQYPKLASVDMRYERQVVLEMQPGSAKIPESPAHGAKDETKALVPATHPATVRPVKAALPHPATKKRDLTALGQPHYPAEAAPSR